MTRYPFYRRPGEPQRRSGQVRETPSPTGVRFPDRPSPSEPLYRLRYPVPRCHSPYDRNLTCNLFHDADSAAYCRMSIAVIVGLRLIMHGLKESGLN